MKRRTRNERRQRRIRICFWLSVALWASIIIWLLTVPVKSKDAPDPQKTALKPVIEEQEDVGALPGDDRPASGYANLDLLECLGQFKVTAYCSCPVCCGIWSDEHPSRIDTGYIQRTASGTEPAAEHTVAADWSVLPEGTEILINGAAYTVEDTGSGVRGRHIDIYMDDHAEACEWGVQYLDVYREAK